MMMMMVQETVAQVSFCLILSPLRRITSVVVVVVSVTSDSLFYLVFFCLNSLLDKITMKVDNTNAKLGKWVKNRSI